MSDNIRPEPYRRSKVPAKPRHDYHPTENAALIQRYVAPGRKPGRGMLAEFASLKERWKQQTMFTSSSSERVMNMCYQRIIGLGPDVIPLLLAEMEREPDHWHWALTAITGENPVPETARGRVTEVARAWVEWGRARGLRG